MLLFPLINPVTLYVTVPCFLYPEEHTPNRHLSTGTNKTFQIYIRGKRLQLDVNFTQKVVIVLDTLISLDLTQIGPGNTGGREPVLILPSPTITTSVHTCLVTLAKWLKLSMPWFPHYKLGTTMRYYGESDLGEHIK